MLVMLIGIVMVEFSQAGEHQACSCCNTACHGAVKTCSGNSSTIQLFLLKSNALPKLAFAGYLAQEFYFIYRYLSVRAIFHPPKIS
jgi:hypothetical protein